MKFTVEVEDFWMDKEDNLTETLQAYIKRDVVAQISANIKEQTQKQIAEKVQETIMDKVNLVVDSELTDLIATGMLTINKQEVSIIDHIRSVFDRNNSWSNPVTQIAKIAKDFTNELKKQYDMVFANQIVVKMKEQGFLKDDLVQVLLTDRTENK